MMILSVFEITVLVLLGLILLSVFALIIISVRKKGGRDASVHEKLNKIGQELMKIDPLLREEFSRSRQENYQTSKDNRVELNDAFLKLGDNLKLAVSDFSKEQKNQFDQFSGNLGQLTKSFEDKSRTLEERLEKKLRESRIEQTETLKSFEHNFSQNINEFNEIQKQHFNDFITRQESIRKETRESLKEIRETVEGKLTYLQKENNNRLDEMRKVVDEKLQESVEKRFNESFKMISERLDLVHKGLGEMQNLASGVGDLKKVLSNVKTRGNLGEIQLGAILEQILSPDQYQRNVKVKENSKERVEYAVNLPDKNDEQKNLLLPIDSKFPVEDYRRLMEAYDHTGDLKSEEVKTLSKKFEESVKKNAGDISQKYINPPVTTDFAIMFVPTEGLYAEILQRPGLFDTLQRNMKITVVGPTNLVAFLSSLQMGFKTLAIQRRSSEVWKILGAVKNEFGSFGSVLEKTRKKLQEAQNHIEKAGTRSRAIERKLRDVEEMPYQNTELLEIAEEE